MELAESIELRVKVALGVLQEFAHFEAGCATSRVVL
jgi:hypothetical protein